MLPISEAKGEAPGLAPKPDLVCLSHLRWDFVYQRPQHLMSRFARDRRVFFFEEPIGHDGPARLEVSERPGGVRVNKASSSPLTDRGSRQFAGALTVTTPARCGSCVAYRSVAMAPIDAPTTTTCDERSRATATAAATSARS